MRFLTSCLIAVTPFILHGSFVQMKPVETSNEQVPEEKGLCHSPFHSAHIDLRHTESKGVGYKNGYTTLEWFGILDHNAYFMPFLDLRGHVFNDGQLAGNFGLGERSIIPSINHAFGLYVYYDIRQQNHGLTVNQISPGIELLGRRMEYRMNGYFPVGRTKSHSWGHAFHQFKGHRMIVTRKRKYALTGGDAEVGVHMTQSTRHDVYAGAGPYYFTADPFSSWGGKARLLWRYQDYISLEASYSYDKLFRNIFQGTLGLMYPFGKKLHRKGNGCSFDNDLTLSRVAFAPYRFEIPVVKRHHHHKASINPATDLPWNVWFVNNTSSSLGTFESPFPTLAQAQSTSGPNDMIYVFPGDGTTTGMASGIILQNGQKLFGSGTIQSVKTTWGRVTIPALSSTSPTITNSVANVVTLASGNEVSGFSIQNTVASTVAVFGATGTNGAIVSNNNITGNQSFGIQINGSGVVNVINNQIHIVPPPGGGAGILLASDAGTSMNATIANNLVEGFNGGFLNGTAIDVNGGSGRFLITNNVLNMAMNGFEGVRITPSAGANLETVISNNIITGPMITFGIGINGNTNATLDVTITNNTITNVGQAAIFFSSNNTTALVSNNVINGAGNEAVALQGISNSCINIENNQAVNVLNGVALFGGPTGVNTINATGNQFQPIAGGFGINMLNAAPATLCLTLTDNIVTGAGSGFFLRNPAGGTFNATISEGNVGAVTTTGTFNSVAPGTCPQCVP